MSTPDTPAPEVYQRVTPDQLRIYLDFEEIDEVRADLLIQQAEELCRAVVQPLPVGARTVVTSAAARAFVNPQGSGYQVAGPFSLQGSSGGLFLSKDERRTLQLLAGRGSAFTIDPTPPRPSWTGIPPVSFAAPGWDDWA